MKLSNWYSTTYQRGKFLDGCEQHYLSTAPGASRRQAFDYAKIQLEMALQSGKNLDLALQEILTKAGTP